MGTNSRIVRKDILPAFGDLTVDAITVEQVRDWFAAMSARPGIANRAMPVLSMMMRMAELWGYRRHNCNPCTKTRRGHRRHRTTVGYAHLADGHLVEAAEQVGGVIAAAMGSSADAPKASSGVRPCAVEPADYRLHHRTARRVIARKRT